MKTEMIVSAFSFLLLGIVAGGISGLIGIGGGVLIVPALLFLFGFSQLDAQGTTLALLVPPIGLLAAWTYFRHGHIHVPAAVFIATGFVLGAYLGARYALGISEDVLTKLFGAAMLLLSLKMIFL